MSSPASTASASDDAVRRLRVAFNAVDLAIYRRIRALAHAPERVRWARRYSRLGEHGAVWLAIGLLGSAADAQRRGRWVRATACVGGAYLLSTSIKVAIGRRRPVIEDLPHLMATPTGLSFPSSHSTSSLAAARAERPRLPPGPRRGAAAGGGV